METVKPLVEQPHLPPQPGKGGICQTMGEGNVYGLVGASPYSDSKNYTYDFISDHINYTAGGHSIIMGVDYSKADGYSYNTGSSKSFTSHSMKNTSWYIQDDWKIFPRITLPAAYVMISPALILQNPIIQRVTN